MPILRECGGGDSQKTCVELAVSNYHLKCVANVLAHRIRHVKFAGKLSPDPHAHKPSDGCSGGTNALLASSGPVLRAMLNGLGA